jgi:hypothetical protein
LPTVRFGLLTVGKKLGETTVNTTRFQRPRVDGVKTKRQKHAGKTALHVAVLAWLHQLVNAAQHVQWMGPMRDGPNTITTAQLRRLLCAPRVVAAEYLDTGAGAVEKITIKWECHSPFILRSKGSSSHGPGRRSFQR